MRSCWTCGGAWASSPAPGSAGYLQGHLPGARFLDLEAVLTGPTVDATLGRHPLPDPIQLGAGLGALGIDPARPVVVYDEPGSYAAGRAWWGAQLGWPGGQGARRRHPRVAGVRASAGDRGAGRGSGRAAGAHHGPVAHHRRGRDRGLRRHADRRPCTRAVPRGDRADRPEGRAHPWRGEPSRLRLLGRGRACCRPRRSWRRSWTCRPRRERAPAWPSTAAPASLPRRRSSRWRPSVSTPRSTLRPGPGGRATRDVRSRPGPPDAGSAGCVVGGDHAPGPHPGQSGRDPRPRGRAARARRGEGRRLRPRRRRGRADDRTHRGGRLARRRDHLGGTRTPGRRRGVAHPEVVRRPWRGGVGGGRGRADPVRDPTRRPSRRLALRRPHSARPRGCT